VLSFVIKNSVNLVLNFKIGGFRHRIYLRSGENALNVPFVDAPFSEIAEVETGPEEKEAHGEVVVCQ
jgi:hypothetical protein